MTAPAFDITEIIPSKAKTYVGLIGSLLTIIGPYILSSTDALPAPWPLVVGLVFAVLTSLGIYKAPYKPEGTVLAVDPTAPVVSPSVPASAPVVAQPAELPDATPDNPVAPYEPQDTGEFHDPWK